MIMIANFGRHGMTGGSGFVILGMLVGFLLMLLIAAGITLLLIWIVRQSSTAGASGPPSSNKALEILKERFAKGEISQEEFAAMKKELMK